MPREARGCRTRPCDPTGNHDGLTSHRVALRRCLKAPTGQWRTEDPTPRQSRKSRQGSASADLAWIMLCKVPPPLGSSKTRFEEGSGAFFQHAFEEGWKLCLIVLPASMWPPTPVRPPRSAMPAMSIMISGLGRPCLVGVAPCLAWSSSLACPGKHGRHWAPLKTKGFTPYCRKFRKISLANYGTWCSAPSKHSIKLLLFPANAQNTP